MTSLETHDDYNGVPLEETSIDADPFVQFRVWLDEAEAAGVPHPNTMVLGTVDPDGAPAARTVLLKGLVGPSGPAFEFVTDEGSRKGIALLNDPRVSLVFPWYPLERQVIVDGVAHRGPDALSDEYWVTRPRGSQIAAVASAESRPIASRAALEAQAEAVAAQYPEGTPVPRPADWCAWFVTPTAIEFWQGRPSRLHDRLVYRAGGSGSVSGWDVVRLQP